MNFALTYDACLDIDRATVVLTSQLNMSSETSISALHLLYMLIRSICDLFVCISLKSFKNVLKIKYGDYVKTQYASKKDSSIKFKLGAKYHISQTVRILENLPGHPVMRSSPRLLERPQVEDSSKIFFTAAFTQ